MLTAYFDYHVAKLTNLYVTSGSVDIKSLTTMLTSIVRTAYKIFLSKNRDEVMASKLIEGEANLSYHRTSTPDLPAARLGASGSCEAGVNMILGKLSAEAITRLDISIEISAFQLRQLRRHPWVLGHVLRAFETAVPLNIDFRLSFCVRAEDRSFRLVSSKPALKSDAPSPLLGITSALGSG